MVTLELWLDVLFDEELFDDESVEQQPPLEPELSEPAWLLREIDIVPKIAPAQAMTKILTHDRFNRV